MYRWTTEIKDLKLKINLYKLQKIKMNGFFIKNRNEGKKIIFFVRYHQVIEFNNNIQPSLYMLLIINKVSRNCWNRIIKNKETDGLILD